MTTLAIYPETGADAPTFASDDPNAIAAALDARGIRFERWDASIDLGPGADQASVLAAYAKDVARLSEEGGYQSADVVRMTPDHPDREAARAKFLEEHTHAEDEVRFFVEGAGAFYFHIGDEVLQVECTRGDLMSVPAGTRHWFDMGPEPYFCAIRIFTNPDGWVAAFTGDDIASQHPRYGE